MGQFSYTMIVDPDYPYGPLKYYGPMKPWTGWYSCQWMMFE
jgi:hypothetical protein